jgi:hypothetical protein
MTTKLEGELTRELFPFRFRDHVTGKWVRARYRAERQEIARRYIEYEIIGPPEVRDGDPDAPRFTPHGERSSDERRMRQDPIGPEFQPHLAKPPAIDLGEVGLLQVFLRRYVTYCARRRRYASMNGAVRLFAELKGAAASLKPERLAS